MLSLVGGFKSPGETAADQNPKVRIWSTDRFLPPEYAQELELQGPFAAGTGRN